MRRVLIPLLLALVLGGLGAFSSGGQPALAGSAPATKGKTVTPGVVQSTNLTVGGAQQAQAAKLAPVCASYPGKFAACTPTAPAPVFVPLGPPRVFCPAATGTAGTPYSSAIRIGEITALSVSFRVSGSLPAGLSLNPATGAISGTPTTGGTSTFTATATDSAGQSGSASCSITVLGTPIIIGPPDNTLPACGLGGACLYNFSAEGGVPPYTFNFALVSTPPACSTNCKVQLFQRRFGDHALATLIVTGLPGNYTIAAIVQDSAGQTAVRNYIIPINP